MRCGLRQCRAAGRRLTSASWVKLQRAAAKLQAQLALDVRGDVGIDFDSDSPGHRAIQYQIGLPRGVLEDGRPLAFQPSADGREPVAAAFALELGDDPAAPVERLRFAVGAYDPSRELVIDPAYPVYAGFFGDSSYDRGLGIAVDAAGHAYISGETTDPFSQDTDAYVAKIALDGSGYDYISVLGGDGYDAAYDVVVDAAGRASITGATLSDEASFPITRGPDLTRSGIDPRRDHARRLRPPDARAPHLTTNRRGNHA